jgi:uncharacterized protein
VKPSAYNYITRMPDGTRLLFNFYTLNLLTLDQPESDLAEKILENPERYLAESQGMSLFDTLIEKGFIIEDRVNELEILENDYRKGCADRKNLSLTILPSLACNFRCVYCYQKENVQRMRREVQDAIICLVEKNLNERGSLSVNWFGGEPLLQMDIIGRLSKEFIRISKNRDSNYSASIVTNGYLLDRENVKKLEKWQVNEAQVTLDGPQEIHDQRRALKGGQKTFRTIVENIKEASEKIKISVRMNVDETNKNSIRDVIEILVQEGLEQRVAFYLGQTYPYTEICKDIDGSCLSNEVYSLLGLKTLMLLAEHGFSSSFWIPSSRSSYCTADRDSSFVITPSGGIVNCWNETADSNKEIGHLLKAPTGNMGKYAQSWKKYNPFERKECVDCVLLPICMGGCPYRFRLTGKSDCHKWKYHLRESLAYYYYYMTAKREKEIMQHIQKAAEMVGRIKEVSELSASA